jgi:hypothetical protein
MPGKGGIWPDQKSFSVPVEIPEWVISTTRSSSPGTESVTSPRHRSLGPCRMTAVVLTRILPHRRLRLTAAILTPCFRQCKLNLTLLNVN